VLKNDFSTTFSCKKPNDFDGRFFKTWLFQHPVRGPWAFFHNAARDNHLPSLTLMAGGGNFS
jgi:hypothetical protein